MPWMQIDPDAAFERIESRASALLGLRLKHPTPLLSTHHIVPQFVHLPSIYAARYADVDYSLRALQLLPHNQGLILSIATAVNILAF